MLSDHLSHLMAPQICQPVYLHLLAVIAIASSEFESGLGGYSTGTLYAMYTLSALLFSSGVVIKLGAKYVQYITMVYYQGHVQLGLPRSGVLGCE